MDTKIQLAEKLQAANNILVTVSNNPTVDQLSACIGMTLWLNKMNKHGTAVFSGDIPNTLEFLQPEATLEKNTDSLRDFIIALDKSKADKLRYKVEDRVVKIYITPYRTSLSEDDLEFSQGDFNVDAIVAIGVSKQEDLDQAIMAHGRILHDAVVTTINTSSDAGLGSINWIDTTASSLSELVYDLCQSIDAKQLDPQIATALLTGIVSETERFSNNKTTPNTMSVAAALMGAGANQQLVANKLEEGQTAQSTPTKPIADNDESQSTSKKEDKPEEKTSDGTLEIEHTSIEPLKPEAGSQAKEELEALAEEEAEPSDIRPPKDLGVDLNVHQDEPQTDSTQTEEDKPNEDEANKFVSEPPQLGGMLSANTIPDDEMEPSSDPLSLPPVDSVDSPRIIDQAASHDEPSDKEAPKNPDVPESQPPAGPGVSEDTRQTDGPKEKGDTLSELEKAVDSPHLGELRDKASDALESKTNGENKSQVEFNPNDFTIDEHDDPDAPPQVPPPIVPPGFLPPEPPAS